MPATYSPSLRLELIGAGEQAANWNNTTNYNLGTLLEQAIAGVQSVAVSGASYTLTTGSGVADEARNAVLVLTGTLAASCNVIVPTADKTYTFRNATTGGFSVVVKTAAGSGVTIANGFTQQVYCDATNVVAAGVPFNAATNTIATNVTGNVSGNVTGNVTGTAANVTGTVAVANGGTGATDAATARSNLGLGSIATQSAASVAITGGSISGITDLAVADGGTGASDAATARTNLGSAASGLVTGSGLTISTANVAGRVSGGTGAFENIPLGNASAALSLGINRGTEQATTSGTAIDFTGIPSGVRRVTVMFDAVSFNGSDGASIQLGDSGGIETTGYTGNTGIVAGLSSGTIGTLSTAAVVIYAGTAAVDNCSGVIHIVNQSGNKWLITGQTARNGTSQIYNVLAAKTLSDVLDRIRFKVDGANSFDAGSINIMWEF